MSSSANSQQPSTTVSPSPFSSPSPRSSARHRFSCHWAALISTAALGVIFAACPPVSEPGVTIGNLQPIETFLFVRATQPQRICSNLSIEGRLLSEDRPGVEGETFFRLTDLPETCFYREKEFRLGDLAAGTWGVTITTGPNQQGKVDGVPFAADIGVIRSQTPTYLEHYQFTPVGVDHYFEIATKNEEGTGARARASFSLERSDGTTGRASLFENGDEYPAWDLRFLAVRSRP